MTVHPGAWWLWAGALAVSASLTTNVLVLLLLVAVVCVVVATGPRGGGPAGFGLYLVVAASVVVLRVVFRVVFPTADGGDAVIMLPSLSLGQLELFGPVSAGALVSGLTGGVQLAVMILAVGAAQSLADPRDLLKHAPPALAGLSTALVIAVSVFPALTRSVHDVRRAARLRGGRTGVRGLVVPVLEGAMDRALALGAAMEARGLGASATTRSDSAAAPAARRTERLQTALVLVSVLSVALAAYALLDTSWPGWAALVLGALAVLAASAAALVDRARRRTVYRPRPWGWRSTATGATGALCLATLLVTVPLAVRHPGQGLLPDLTVWGLLAPLLACLPVLLAPRERA